MNLKDLRTEVFTLHTGTRPKAKDVMAKVDECIKQACFEQRKLCHESHERGGSIRNAPEPEFK